LILDLDDGRNISVPLAWFPRLLHGTEEPVKQIVFEGERFDVMSVRQWRDKMLGNGSP
jgi:hypothetical protein